MPLAVLPLVAALLLWVRAAGPHQPGHHPGCPLLRLTGLFCPGCGGLRALHALAHGDPLAALGANAAVVVGGAALVLGWLVWCAAALRGRAPEPPAPRAVHGWAVCALVLAFTVVRNLPFGSALAP